MAPSRSAPAVIATTLGDDSYAMFPSKLVHKIRNVRDEFLIAWHPSITNLVRVRRYVRSAPVIPCLGYPLDLVLCGFAHKMGQA